MNIKKRYLAVTHRALSPALFVVGIVLTYGSIWLFWDTDQIPTIVTAAVSLALLLHLNSRKIFVVYVCGMVIGAGMEVLSVAQGLWTYQYGTVLGVPPYLFAVWGVIGVLAVMLYKYFGGNADDAEYFSHGTTVKRGLMVFGLPILGIICMWIFWSTGFWAVVLVSVLAFAQLWHFHSRALLLIFFFSVCAGILGDVVSVPQGIWYYADASGFMIPLVIFPAWGIMGAFFATLYDLCERFSFLRKKIVSVR